jgi:hypothetical protein
VRELWPPPKVGSFKVNFDTTIRDLFSVQAAVNRVAKGSIIQSWFQFSPPRDPSYGEAQATFLAASLATSLKLGKFVLEGDSFLVISSLQQPSNVLDWRLDTFISLVLSLIPSFSQWQVRKVNINANFCTHYVTY